MTDTTVAPIVRKLEANPEDDDALGQLWKWHVDRQEHESLAALAERIAARRTDPPRAADLYYRAGQLWVDPLRRADRAVALWERALQRDPSHPDSTRALSELYVRTGKHAAAAPLVERRLARATDARDRVGLLHDLLAIREKTGDLVGQIAALDELVSLRPRERELKRQLAKLLVQRARQPDAAESDKLRAARMLGVLAAQSDAAQSTVLAEGALQLWPGEENGFAVLEGAYERAGRNNDLISRRIDFITANPESRVAARVRKQLAAMYTRMKQPERAIEALLPIGDHDVEAARQLAQLYKDTNRHAERAALMKSNPAAFDSNRPGDAVRQRIEALRAAGDHEAMLVAMRELLKLEPGDADALSELEPAARAAGDFATLRDLLRQFPRGEKVASEVKVARWREAALLSEYDLADDAGAIEAWKNVLAESPAHADASQALERLYGRTARWGDLLGHLERAAKAAADSAERKRLWLRHLDVHRLHRDNPAEEASVLQRLWNDEPEDESLAFALVAARRRAGDLSGVTEVLRTLVDDATPENAPLRWTLLAQHLEATHQADAALAAWHRVRTLDPDQSMAWEAEERLLEATGGHGHLLETLVTHAGHPVAAGKHAAALYDRAARVARMLGDEKRAASLLDQARRIQPDIDPLASVIEALGDTASDDAGTAETVQPSAPAAKEATTVEAAAAATEQHTAATAIPDLDVETTSISLRDAPPETTFDADATDDGESIAHENTDPRAYQKTQRLAAVAPVAAASGVNGDEVALEDRDDEITGPVLTLGDTADGDRPSRTDDEPTNPSFQIRSDGTVVSDPRVAAARTAVAPAAAVTPAPAAQPPAPGPQRTERTSSPPTPPVASRAHRKTDPPPPPTPRQEKTTDPPPAPTRVSDVPPMPAPRAPSLPSIIVDEGLLAEGDIPIEIDEADDHSTTAISQHAAAPPGRPPPITERPPPLASTITDRPAVSRPPAAPPVFGAAAPRPPGPPNIAGPPPLFGNGAPVVPPLLTATPARGAEPPSLYEAPSRSPFAQTAVGPFAPTASQPMAASPFATTAAPASAPMANSPFANIPSRRIFARPMTQLFEQMRSGRR